MRDRILLSYFLLLLLFTGGFCAYGWVEIGLPSSTGNWACCIVAHAMVIAFLALSIREARKPARWQPTRDFI